MDITYKWSISGVDGTPREDDGRVNIVRVIHWRCHGYPTSNPEIGNNRNGFVILETPTDEHAFVDFQDITERMVMRWLFEALTAEGKKKVEDEIAQQLEQIPAMLAIKNKTPLWMHWDPNNGPEPTPPPPVEIEPVTQTPIE